MNIIRSGNEVVEESEPSVSSTAHYVILGEIQTPAIYFHRPIRLTWYL